MFLRLYAATKKRFVSSVKVRSRAGNAQKKRARAKNEKIGLARLNE